MIISFSPMRRDDTLVVSKSGDALTINGEVFDFTDLPDGATLPRGSISCEWISSAVDRIDGEIHLTLLLPHGPNPPDDVAFPEPISPGDGIVLLPGASI